MDFLVRGKTLFLACENLDYALACFNKKGECFYLNRNAKKIFSQEGEPFWRAKKFKNLLERQYSENNFEFVKFDQSFMVETKIHNYECEYKIVRDKKGRTKMSYLKLDDVSEELLLIEKQKIQIERDALTGLYNRKTFFKYAEEILHSNSDKEFLLIATNILDFKIANSIFGEKVANEVLKLEAFLISSSNSPSKICGRISGDKFAILVQKKFFKIEKIFSDNEMLQQSVKTYNFKIQRYSGIYEVSDHFENVKTMFDKAMLATQTIRGNIEKFIAYYDIPIMEKMLNEKRILSSFNDALENGEFSMFLHPQVDAKTLRVIGAEALVRWNVPGKGTISPCEFVPLLEQAGLIHKLDMFIWETAAKKLSEWKKNSNEMYISINVSAKDFYYCDVYKIFTQLVEKYKIAPQKLNIEITETVLMQNIEIHKNILSALREYGFAIEMDDFGSGYSSLDMLKNLEMNFLKIDMDFLREWDSGEKSRKIISAIIKMAKQLGMTVVSEGVETKEQAQFLYDADCDIFQGYYFSKPIPVNEFEKKYIFKKEETK